MYATGPCTTVSSWLMDTANALSGSTCSRRCHHQLNNLRALNRWQAGCKAVQMGCQEALHVSRCPIPSSHQSVFLLCKLALPS